MRGPVALSSEAVRSKLKGIAAKIVSISQLHRVLAEEPYKRDVNICDHMVSLCTALVSSAICT